MAGKIRWGPAVHGHLDGWEWLVVDPSGHERRSGAMHATCAVTSTALPRRKLQENGATRVPKDARAITRAQPRRVHDATK